ncbi:HAD family hydrolase [Pokkaliibacter sp. MBI-7]|uniref:HAD family hydrolase n=1 Tax=Pokkaliibacter sp. MBI-7 TaxID=3040600 RepID=UPI00244B49F5|nr:HAD family hydrolase [Pokkaliibacter sp. MBI-7]MDH2432762.1 HAD family hydrolase [Pokkaliibacter sp. MBI-7]
MSMIKPIPVPVKNPHLDWICFDLDDTLWAVEPVIDRANSRMFDWLASNVPGAAGQYSVTDWPRLRDGVRERFPATAHSVTALRQTVLDELMAALGHQGEQAAAWSQAAFEAFRVARNEVELFAPVESMLTTLQQAGYRLGVFSNGNADLQQIGIGRYFEVVLNADMVGAAKPEAAAFSALVQACGSEPRRMVYVGDHPHYDVAGANAAGLFSLWFNPEGVAWPAGQQRPSLEVACLSEIAAALALLQP